MHIVAAIDGLDMFDFLISHDVHHFLNFFGEKQNTKKIIYFTTTKMKPNQRFSIYLHAEY